MSAKERQKGTVTKDSVTLLPCFYFVEVSGRPRRAGPWGAAAGVAGQARGAGGGRGERRGREPLAFSAEGKLASALIPHCLMQNPSVMLHPTEISIEAPRKVQA